MSRVCVQTTNVKLSGWEHVQGSHQVSVSYTIEEEPMVAGTVYQTESDNILLLVVDNTTMVSLPMGNIEALRQLNKIEGEMVLQKINIGALYIDVLNAHIHVRLPVKCFHIHAPNITFKVTDHLEFSVTATHVSLSAELEVQVTPHLDTLLALYDISASENSWLSKVNALGNHETHFSLTETEETSIFKILGVEIVDVANFASQQKAIIYFTNTSAEIEVAPKFEIFFDTHYFDFEFKGKKDDHFWAITTQLVSQNDSAHIQQHLKPNSLWKSHVQESNRLNPENMAFKIASICTWLDVDHRLDVKCQVTRAYQKLKLLEPENMRTSLKIEKLFSYCQDIEKTFPEPGSTKSFKVRIGNVAITNIDSRIQHMASRKRKK